MLLVVLLGLVAAVRATDRPIVGILAQEVPPETYKAGSYIPASYVKAVEAAGARVVPIFVNRSEDYYSYILSAVNGVVFPGGGTNFSNLHGYAEAGGMVLDIARKLQDSGVFFPILGVCQGYELLMFLEAKKSNDILVQCNATNVALPLIFSKDYQQSSLYKYASQEVLTILSTLPVTSNHHKFCVTERTLREFGLEKTWRVLSTNNDSNGLQYVSSSEHCHRPLAGIQFHPEKNAYEWNPAQANPHQRKAVLSARLFYDWLVAESRLNNQSFLSAQEEVDHLIFNYSPVYTGRAGGYDQQIYFF